MNGLMMDYQLTLPAMLRRTKELFPRKEIVSRLPDKSIHSYTYADFATRAKKLALALEGVMNLLRSGLLMRKRGTDRNRANRVIRILMGVSAKFITSSRDPGRGRRR